MADVQSVEFTINFFAQIDVFFSLKVGLFVFQQRKVLLEYFFKCKRFKKNHTHVKKVGHIISQNFCLPFIDELEKQLFIKKPLKWANKKCKNFNIYNVVVF